VKELTEEGDKAIPTMQERAAIQNLTPEERAAIKKLVLEHPELTFCIIEEILEWLPNGDEILIKGLERWRKKDE